MSNDPPRISQLDKTKQRPRPAPSRRQADRSGTADTNESDITIVASNDGYSMASSSRMIDNALNPKKKKYIKSEVWDMYDYPWFVSSSFSVLPSPEI